MRLQMWIKQMIQAMPRMVPMTSKSTASVCVTPLRISGFFFRPDRLIHATSRRKDTGTDQYKAVPTAIQLVGYRHADEALMNAAAVVDSILHGKAV
jgi:hypothetical protein